jgi:alanine racemase
MNTGMNRLGLSLIELLSALEIIKKSSLIPEGIYTHFHSSDSNPKATLTQLDEFNQAVFQAKYYFPKILAHSANSSAIFSYPQTHLDIVRPGIALYKDVLSLYCHSTQTRKLSKNETIGYSATYKSNEDEFMSVLPIGYSDGYDRKLSNLGRVYSQNQYFPVIGNISMNFTTILGKTSTSPIELLGSHITAAEIAKLTGTIDYEVLSRLSPTIPRMLV